MQNRLNKTTEARIQYNEKILLSPASVPLFQYKPDEGPGSWIAYEEHPAYSVFTRSKNWWQRVSSLTTFSLYFGIVCCKRATSYELIPTHMRAFWPANKALMFFRQAFKNLVMKAVPSLPDHKANFGFLLSRELEQNGVCVLKMKPEQIDLLLTITNPLFQQLRKKRMQSSSSERDFSQSRMSALRTEHSKLFAAVEKILEETGCLDGISGYLGHRASLVDVNPQINDSTDDFWRRVFVDLNLPAPPTAYIHRDASGGDIKIIIYLTNVEDRSGPFSYIIGSHRVRSSTSIDWIEETNDQSGFSSTDVLSRRRFAALPKILRRKCAFGNDIMPNSEIAKDLCKSEWIINAPQGHLVVFDPKGFHRGGMVLEGERMVLTCILGSSKRGKNRYNGKQYS